MLAAFVVTVLAGLAINFGLHYLVAGILLNVWFLIALALAGLPARISANPWQQALAWQPFVTCTPSCRLLPS